MFKPKLVRGVNVLYLANSNSIMSGNVRDEWKGDGFPMPLQPKS